MDIPKEAHKDHSFTFVEHLRSINQSGQRDPMYDTWVYRCQNCGLWCWVGKGYPGHWHYHLEGCNMIDWDLEALKCDEVLVMDILE